MIFTDASWRNEQMGQNWMKWANETELDEMWILVKKWIWMVKDRPFYQSERKCFYQSEG